MLENESGISLLIDNRRLDKRVTAKEKNGSNRFFVHRYLLMAIRTKCHGPLLILVSS